MMLKRFLLVGALTICHVTVVQNVLAQDTPAAPVKDDKSIGYFLGFSVGQQMKQNGFQNGDFSIESMMTGFSDGFENKDPGLTDEQLRETQGKIQALLQKRQVEMQAEQKAKGEKFLAENAKAEGVKKLDGGVQYKVLTAGKGDSPKPTDTVKVHYTGKLVDGSVFDSSVQRGEPATFRVNQVIKGWQTALQAMKVGDKWMLYIPSDLAYGERGSQGAIGPNEVLIFEVELLGIQ
ncbi:MAG: FKBP-type peptidyl-prolyl cis-trans isomerase [Rubripirellula sp.]